jgi:hypothetical protein
MPFIMSRTEFHDLHRKSGDPVTNGKWHLYKDGAMMAVYEFGGFIDPPADRLELAKLIHRYWEIREQYAVEDFANARNVLLRHAEGMRVQRLPVDQGLLNQLNDAETAVQVVRRKLRFAAAAVERAQPPGTAEREEAARRSEAERIERNEDFVQEVHRLSKGVFPEVYATPKKGPDAEEEAA